MQHHTVNSALTLMKNIFFLFIIPFIISSCTTPRYSYAPTRVNAPLLQQKNEVQLDASLPVLRGFDASGAYAITDHFGLMLNGSWRDHRQHKSGSINESLSPNLIKYHRSAADLGIGWFTGVGSNVHLELFTGMGKGKFSIADVGTIRGDTSMHYSRNLDCKIQRLFIQPAFGGNTRSAQFIFFVRFQWQRFYEVQTDYTSLEMQSYGLPQNPTRFFAFAEPGFTFRFYFRSLPILGFETNFLLSRAWEETMDAIPVHFSVGLHARFPKQPPK